MSNATPHLAALAGHSVLITGAAGFIGTHLCRTCADAGAEVVGVSRSPRADGRGLRWAQADLGDLGAVRSVLREHRPRFVFHLAGDSRASRDLAMVGPTFDANLQAPLNLLTAVTESSGDCRRVVLIGSLEEPRVGSGSGAVPSSPYAASKLAQSQYAAMFHRLYQTPVTVARVFMVYGEEQRDARKLIPSIVLGLLRGESPKMSSGARLVDWVHASDVAAGLIALAAAEDASGQAFDLGSGTLASVRSVAERIASMIPEAAGRLQIGGLPDRPMEQERTADVAATAAAIGWRPRVTLDEGLRQAVAWYREHLTEFY